ncbi:MAG TPA: hypothetical protein VFW09_02000 [Solirubrobacteraceae bacterium]|nr:hypothetical protein [Solirubrobacteraceae bacterium]
MSETACPHCETTMPLMMSGETGTLGASSTVPQQQTCPGCGRPLRRIPGSGLAELAVWHDDPEPPAATAGE